jgi:head-tail adaptor
MRLRHRIKLQSNSPTQDATGQPIESWSTYTQAWANVTDKSGREVSGDPVEGLVETQAVMRYPHAGRIPQPSDRWLHGEGDVLRTFNIEAVQRIDGQRRMLKLIGTEVQNG